MEEEEDKVEEEVMVEVKDMENINMVNTVEAIAEIKITIKDIMDILIEKIFYNLLIQLLM